MAAMLWGAYGDALIASRILKLRDLLINEKSKGSLHKPGDAGSSLSEATDKEGSCLLALVSKRL
eukprot:scaffold101183_cov20-Tisochrysis_lutea.AAC.1